MADHYLPSTAYRTNCGRTCAAPPEIASDVGERAECVESMPNVSNHDALSGKFKCALCVRERDEAMSEMREFLGKEQRLCRCCVLAVDRNRA